LFIILDGRIEGRIDGNLLIFKTGIINASKKSRLDRLNPKWEIYLKSELL
jgi:hypothetical protein